MKIVRIELIEEHTVILEQGTDYEPDDLIPDKHFPGIRLLPSDHLQKLAEQHGFDKWTFGGHPAPHDEIDGAKGIQAKFAKVRD